MDKPWYRSKTAWGAVLVGGGMVATSAGKALLGEIDANTALIGISTGVGIVLVAVGLRDAVSNIPKK